LMRSNAKPSLKTSRKSNVARRGSDCSDSNRGACRARLDLRELPAPRLERNCPARREARIVRQARPHERSLEVARAALHVVAVAERPRSAFRFSAVDLERERRDRARARAPPSAPRTNCACAELMLSRSMRHSSPTVSALISSLPSVRRGTRSARR
jgi:hypothetical protein